jgi:YesN/AraC family two-component response regulator
MLDLKSLSAAAAGFTVLYVEDDEFLQEETSELLSNFFTDIVLAPDGEQGLARYLEQPCDIVVTDINMPNMNGIEMSRQILAQNPNQTVIVISAHDESQYLMELINLGIKNFISKPLVLDTFLEVLQRVCGQMHEERAALREIEESRESIELLRQGTFRFRTPEEVKNLSMLLARLFPQPEKALYGLKELCLNAVEHGNLGITYDEKTALNEKNEWHAEVDRRLTSAEYGHRYAEVECERTEEMVKLVIRDQGKGFNYEKYLTIDQERLFHSHGRGIAMSKAMAFDELEYQGDGNIVQCIVYLNKGA